MKMLIVGDPHATVEELRDCQRLVDLIVKVVAKEKPNVVLFLGDQHHNHAVVRVEVIDFWRKSYGRIKEGQGEDFKIWCLIGNHDKPGDSSAQSHAMQAYEDLVTPIVEPMNTDGLLLLSYYHNPEEFRDTCHKYYAKTLICHQTFDGSKYENGFYAKDGIQIAGIPQENIISGHIHTPQKFGKVWYPGAPRWRIKSDVNTERAIWAVTFKGGVATECVPYSTSGYCRELYEFEDREGIKLSPRKDLLEPCHITVNIYGSKSYVDKKAVYWKEQGIHRIKTFSTEVHAPRVRESDGVAVALQKFVVGYQPRHGTSIEVLRKMIGERVSV